MPLAVPVSGSRLLVADLGGTNARFAIADLEKAGYYYRRRYYRPYSYSYRPYRPYYGYGYRRPNYGYGYGRRWRY